MPQAHRNGDLRTCGGATIVTGQGTVFVNGQLWSVLGDPDSHGSGALIATGTTVFAGGLPVIVLFPDPATPDALCPIVDGPHCNPMTAQGSPNVYAYG